MVFTLVSTILTLCTMFRGMNSSPASSMYVAGGAHAAMLCAFCQHSHVNAAALTATSAETSAATCTA